MSARRPGAALALAALLLCQACGGPSWPAPGQGGMAEAGWTQPLAQQPTAPPLPLRDALSTSLLRTEAARRAVERAGVDTGRIATIGDMATRARREFAGGLYTDLPLTLARLDAELRQLCSELDKAEPAAADCA